MLFVGVDKLLWFLFHILNNKLQYLITFFKDLAAQVENGGMTRMEVARFSIESETHQLIQDDIFVDNFGLGEFQLVAPAVLFKKRKYPPLHIFVRIFIYIF